MRAIRCGWLLDFDPFFNYRPALLEGSHPDPN